MAMGRSVCGRGCIVATELYLKIETTCVTESTMLSCRGLELFTVLVQLDDIEAIRTDAIPVWAWTSPFLRMQPRS